MSTQNFSYEVDFLPVGDGSRSADAIAIRYGQLATSEHDHDNQKVIIIDGGTKESGKALIEHVKKFYHTNVVDLVVMTHPDTDHCSGLTEVLESLTVRELWMHQPWNHSADIRRLFHDGRLTNNSLEKHIRVGLDAAEQVEIIALQQNIHITEPFAGEEFDGGVIKVLGPTKEYYQGLIPNFRSTPDAAVNESVLGRTFTALKKAFTTVTELFDFSSENLPGEQGSPNSAENNSSSVLLFQIDGHKMLITGDAGIPSLKEVNDYALSIGIRLDDLNFMQVPHHGSKRNVDSNTLDNIKAKTAFISAAKEGAPKHPSQRVINALTRRGTNVFVTQGSVKCHRHKAPNRPGWGSAVASSFKETYEE
ncbi:hypothetical protein LGH70_02245 [Hymenobacter sp. BT635]|uniref:Metallo-beta-lactamase domain-containing protein n=1 Tax=Hymenobacter nitidus TaxID=2880929 RepID=A0ABS8A7L1_9BACT|nr:MBL fold metallo-hydrolase [Hymenobacter nitidus]MCB2376383.1 hypothetical protein [Hymenobacter nitidus]